MQSWLRPLIAYRRFHEKHTPDGCWEWLGHVDSNGYGVLYNCRAHRVAVTTWGDCNGVEIPLVGDSRDVHHKCLNRSCFRPDHLQVMTRAEHAEAHRLLNESNKSV